MFYASSKSRTQQAIIGSKQLQEYRHIDVMVVDATSEILHNHYSSANWIISSEGTAFLYNLMLMEI